MSININLFAISSGQPPSSFPSIHFGLLCATSTGFALLVKTLKGTERVASVKPIIDGVADGPAKLKSLFIKKKALRAVSIPLLAADKQACLSDCIFSIKIFGVECSKIIRLLYLKYPSDFDPRIQEDTLVSLKLGYLVDDIVNKSYLHYTSSQCLLQLTVNHWEFIH